MKLTLTITASGQALAKILASLDGDAVAVVEPVQSTPVAAPVQSAPVAAPVQSAPVMPEVIAAAPTITGEPEFDSTGLAWDERIHSKQKGQTNDGRWRKQRGVDEDYYKQVEAELRARYGSQAAPVVIEQPAPVVAPAIMATPVPVEVPMGNVPPMPIMSMPSADMEHQVDDVDSVASEPVAVIPMPALAPIAAPAEEPVTFHTIMTHIGGAMSSGAITPDYLVQLVSEINQQCGTAMQSFTDMAAFPQAVEYCWAALARDGKR